MKPSSRLAVGLVATALLAGGMAGTATADPAPITVKPGTFLDFDNDLSHSGTICTLGAVGTDAAGRKVGITAGHCNPGSSPEETNPINPGATQGVPITDDDHPVYDRNQLLAANVQGPNDEIAPIGYIRWVSVNSQSYTSTTDYMVIEFAPHVNLSSVVGTNNQGQTIRISELLKDSTGALTTPAALSSIINFGAATPISEIGIVASVGSNGMFRSWARFYPGDSGGPAIAAGTSKWAGIITRTRYLSELTFPQWEYTSAKNILNDLNPRGIVGSGFTPTNN